MPVGAVVNCADNTGAKTLKVIQVQGYKGRLSRLPAASVGDQIKVIVKRGPPEMRKQTFDAVLVRQKYPIRRANGNR
ncbi:MAG: uL14 family ribosomal protein, partial [Nitrososphaerales archaeon]